MVRLAGRCRGCAANGKACAGYERDCEAQDPQTPGTTSRLGGPATSRLRCALRAPSITIELPTLPLVPPVLVWHVTKKASFLSRTRYNQTTPLLPSCCGLPKTNAPA